MDEECSICLEYKTDLGEYLPCCAHRFCFQCISTWVLASRAYCPMCLQPAFGLRVPQGNKDIYLSPHFGLFGFSFTSVRDRFRVVDVVRNPNPNLHRIQVGAYYIVNGHRNAEECEVLIKTAHLYKRMIKLSPVNDDTVISCLYSLNCLVRPRLKV